MNKTLGKRWLEIAGVILFLYIQQFQLSYSATVGLKNNLTIALPWVLINMLFVSIPFLVELMFFKKTKLAIAANAILFTLLSIGNYHVLLFRGSPFLAGDIFSISTALNVMSEYNFVFDSIVQRICILFGIELLLWLMIYRIILGGNLKLITIRRRISGGLSFGAAAIIFILFFSPFAIFE